MSFVFDRGDKMKHKSNTRWNLIPKWVWLLISLGVALALWLFASSRWPIIFANPEQVWQVFLEKGVHSTILWEHVWASLSRVLTGFGIAFLLAIPIAFLMAWYEPLSLIHI